MGKLSGRCFCGGVTWSYEGEVIRNLVCHCTDCQRATSSPFTAFTGLRPQQVTWSGEINHYESSQDTWRGFCPECGTRLYFKSGKWPGVIHVHAATLDDPDSYLPTAQVVLQSKADWLKYLGEIPEHQGFSAAPATGIRQPDVGS